MGRVPRGKLPPIDPPDGIIPPERLGIGTPSEETILSGAKAWKHRRELIGPQGLGGERGSEGSQGPEGPKGRQGEVGPTGEQGPKGNKGDKGDQGERGATGSGAPGAQGPMGDRGPRGFTGPVGPKGDKGEKGDAGPRGLAGIDGADGAKGSRGDKGDRGYVGPKGEKGDPGEGGGGGGGGEQGPPGPQGPEGPQGPKGDPGATGSQGSAGADGAQGPKGDKGDTGNAGAQGSQGIQGLQGDPGVKGDTGSQGPPGPSQWGGIGGTMSAQTDLQGALDGKSATGHGHGESDVANLVSDLAAKATPADITTHAGLSTGVHGVGGSIIETVAGSAAKVSTHDGLASPHSGATNLEKTASKGTASGYAGLDAGSKVPAANLPDATTTAKGIVELATDGESTANVAVQGNDARMSNARTPTTHSHAESEITGLVTDLGNKVVVAGQIGGTAASPDVRGIRESGGQLLTAGAIGDGQVLARSGAGLVGQGAPAAAAPEEAYYRHYGTTKYEAWHTSPKTGTALAGSALVAGRLYAMPFPVPRGITLDRIGVYVSTLSTGLARLGIYADAGGASLCHPGSLVLDAGTIDVTATGVKSITISQALSQNSLYWLVILCQATPAIYCIPVAAVIAVLGHSNALGTAQNAGLYAAQTYGALPATFPTTPTLITAAPIPAIFVRLSA